MRHSKQGLRSLVGAFLFGLLISANSVAMGLRSFIALPIEKGGLIGRLFYQNTTTVDSLMLNAAYGLSARQSLLFGLPYRLSPAGNNQLGDVSVLYRHILWQDDRLKGTNRFGILLGGVVPTAGARDFASQAGFVFTHFRQRHELDFDALYQKGTGQRQDTGRYDFSWQYRLLPAVRPDWGLGSELNSVLELNGRWQEGNAMVQQVTMGLQWIRPRWVLEGGVVRDISQGDETRYILSTRFHF